MPLRTCRPAYYYLNIAHLFVLYNIGSENLVYLWVAPKKFRSFVTCEPAYFVAIEYVYTDNDQYKFKGLLKFHPAAR